MNSINQQAIISKTTRKRYSVSHSVIVKHNNSTDNSWRSVAPIETIQNEGSKGK
jgi:hypothetical protein